MIFFTSMGLISAAVLAAAPGDENSDGPAQTFEASVPIRAVTHGPKAHWFGYYDKHQFDVTGRYLLGMEVDFEDRTPSPDDVIRLGVIDLEDGDRWTEFGMSQSWGWQQGCMLQWLPGAKTKVVYNDRQDDRFVAVVQDVFTGEKQVLPRPIYAVSADGKRAVGTNFSRIAETRPGYGYAGVADPFADQLHPEEDGVYVMDLDTGESRILFTYDAIAKFPPAKDTGGKHWFNHLLVNPDGTRFIFLHRWKLSPTAQRWGTRMFTAGIDGSDLRCLSDHGMVSHFIWRNPAEILAWSTEPEQTRFHLYEDRTENKSVIGQDVLIHDGHCTYSPDGEWVLTDKYPGRDRMQDLMLYRPSDGKLVPLGRFYLAPERHGELRCDLHPRWDRSGSRICIDSMHARDQRQIHVLDVREITKP